MLSSVLFVEIGYIDDLLLPYEIDLNIFDLIQNENLKEHILRCGRVIYESRNNEELPE